MEGRRGPREGDVEGEVEEGEEVKGDLEER
jgi:hypothetical protein